MQVLAPFRAVGNVCGAVPVSFTTLYEQPVLMVATGRTFQLYRGNELSMLRGGPMFEKRVAAVAQTGKYRFVAEGSNVHAFNHHKAMWTAPHNSVTLSKPTLMVARDELLFTIGEDRVVVVWDIRTGERLRDFLIGNNATPNVAIIAEGYPNKLLVGTREGGVQLYNFMKGTLLFDSKEASEADAAGPSSSVHHQRSERLVELGDHQILCMACSKYRDLIAYGTSDGRVVVYNYGTDEEIASFKHDGASVTAVSFRTDRDGVVVSGTSQGEIAIWDIAGRTLEGVIARTKQVKSQDEVLDQPHADAVHSLISFPNSHVLVSAAADNALLQYRFDTIDGQGLLVRERRGHMGACTVAHFFNGDLLVTAGVDQALRVTHVFSDRAAWELSQGKLGKRQREKQLNREALKLPPATALASSTNRNYQWSALASIHDCSAQLCGWRMDTRALECKLSGISTSMHTSRCVTVSACGSFAIVGYSSGNLVSVHLQNKSIKQFLSDKHGDRAHNGSVECAHVCKGNTVVVSSGGDGKMMLWDLMSHRLLRIVNLEATPTGASCLHAESSLFIVAGIDHVIRAYSCNPDSTDGTALRTFRGHRGQVTAMAITPDTYQHVISASTDGAVLVWDLSGGVCVGAYRTPSPLTSLSFHPDALFLATTHSGERGCFLWTNNLRYGFAPEVVPDPSSLEVSELPLLHFPVGHREDQDASAEAEDGTAAASSSMVKMAKKTLKSLDEEESEGEEGADAEGNADGKKAVSDADLFDASKDVALLRRKQDEARRLRLDTLDSVGGLRSAGVAANVWQTLTLIDEIKEKNKPLLPPKKKDVPFFLNTTAEVRPTFIVQLEADAAKAKGEPSTSHFTVGDVSSLTAWQTALVVDDSTEEGKAALAEAFEQCLRAFVTRQSPAAEIDLEVRSLVQIDEELLNNHPSFAAGKLATNQETTTRTLTSQRRDAGLAGDCYSDDEVRAFVQRLARLLDFVTYHISRGSAVDLMEGILGAILKAHGTAISRLSPFKDAVYVADAKAAAAKAGAGFVKSYPNALACSVDRVIAAQERVRHELDHMLGLPGCLVSAFSNAY